MSKPSPKYIHAVNRIKDSIKHQQIADKLPGERVLAKELGISYMTVRKAIDNLVERGYLYRIPAKGTFVADRKKVGRVQTKNIGYFLDSSIKDGLTSPYYSLIFNALEKETGKRGYALVYFSNINEENAISTLKKVDGVIASCFPRVEHVIQEIKQHVPVVVIDNASFDKSIPSIIIDNFGAVIESVNALCNLGHQRIGFMTGLDDSDVGNNRLAGYQCALKSHKIPVNSELIYKGDYSYEAGKHGASTLLQLSKPPTAIMCANDSMALGAMKEASRSGYRVPEDLSIVGFDDISVASQIMPPLTTVAPPIDEIAALAVSMVDALIAGKDPDSKHIALPAHLKVRGTSAPPRAASEMAVA